MRKKSVLILTSYDELSEAISIYLETAGDYETFPFTYDKSDLISGEVWRGADIFILELMRCYKNGRIRAEGIMVAEELLKSGRKFLLVNADVVCEEIGSEIYWDIGCKEALYERVEKVLRVDMNEKKVEFERIKNRFKEFLKPPDSHHHHKNVKK